MEENEFDFINVIPLVDIMLVLLTIVLTTTSFVAVGAIPMELPRTQQSYSDALKTQTIEIDRNGNVYLSSAPVSLSELKASLNAVDRSVPVLIRADRYIQLQTFVDVFDVLKTLGFGKISLQSRVKP